MKQQSNNEKQRANVPSSLLSQEENDLVFALLGRKCQTMCTAVTQLYTTEPPAHSSWIRRLTGVTCFVRDVSKKSYFIRVYCLKAHELSFEMELYTEIMFSKPKDFLICFESNDCMVGLSFADDIEANQFYKVATTTTSNRIKRQRRKIASGTTAHSNGSGEAGVVLRNAPNAPTVSPFSQAPQASAFAGNMGMGNGRDKKRSNRKLTKADISMPTDFKHIVHVGWSAQKGYDLNSDEVNTLQTFLEKAGVSTEQLEDRSTRNFVYDFISKHQVLDSVKSEKEQYGPPPPPVPSRNNAMQRIAPPPPPAPASNTAASARLPAELPTTKTRPARPPPIEHIQNQTAAAPPPPPPPPPMPPNPMPPTVANVSVVSAKTPVPVVNDTRNALMESIRKGTTLKKVDATTLSTGSGSDDGRNNLLKEIRQGVELRPAGERELSQRESGNNFGTDALADALKRALQERSRALQSSDSSSSSDNDEWDD